MKNLSAAATALIEEQCGEWGTAGDNFAALRGVEVKNFEVKGFDFKIQFNPKRIQSSAAKVDAKSIQERQCFLCGENRPTVQRGIPFTAQSGVDYTILVNPFPIFTRHLTIPAIDHIDQRIAGRIEDMLSLSASLTDYLVFYNGPKCGASAPDHFHFQAGNKGFLPLEVDIDKIIEEKGTKLSDELFTLPSSPIHTIIYRSTSTARIIEWFDKFYAAFAAMTPGEVEPMMNILSWKTGETYYLVVFPRRAHRPVQFFAEGDDNILISPASIDLGGVFITPLEKDFVKITPEDVADILGQISVTPQTFNQLCKI